MTAAGGAGGVPTQTRQSWALRGGRWAVFGPEVIVKCYEAVWGTVAPVECDDRDGGESGKRGTARGRVTID